MFGYPDKPLKVVTDAHPILTIIPAEMISAYVPYQSGLDLEHAAKIALILDEQAAQSLEASVQDA